MAESQVLDIILLVVAGVILFRLYAVLGRRTGHERTREDFPITGAQPQSGPADNVVALPDHGTAKTEQAQSVSDPVAGGLMDIKLADRNFETDRFLAGAKAAYEMILTAFANGDRQTLRPLVNDEVYGVFNTSVAGREQKNEKTQFTFVGYKDVKVVHAALKARIAEITVAFGAQFISVTRDAAGAVVDGDAKSVRDVTDVWTFSRDVRARDPNWMLVATSGEPA